MNLNEIRKEIDEIDKTIISLIAKRMSLMPEIAARKAEINAPISDPGREKRVIETRLKMGKDNALSPELIERVFRLIIEESCRVQEQPMEKKKGDFNE